MQAILKHVMFEKRFWIKLLRAKHYENLPMQYIFFSAVKIQNFNGKILIFFIILLQTAWFVSDLVANPKCCLSHAKAQFISIPYLCVSSDAA